MRISWEYLGWQMREESESENGHLLPFYFLLTILNRYSLQISFQVPAMNLFSAGLKRTKVLAFKLRYLFSRAAL